MLLTSFSIDDVIINKYRKVKGHFVDSNESPSLVLCPENGAANLYLNISTIRDSMSKRRDRQAEYKSIKRFLEFNKDPIKRLKSLKQGLGKVYTVAMHVIN